MHQIVCRLGWSGVGKGRAEGMGGRKGKGRTEALFVIVLEALSYRKENRKLGASIQCKS